MPDRVITTDELAAALRNEQVHLIDVRPLAAYNGWSLRHERRGGHIDGAKTFPEAWLKLPECTDLLNKKQISWKSAVIVYGYDADDTNASCEALHALGFSDVRAYYSFMEWSQNDKLPMDALPRYDRLIYPEWLKDLLDGGTPPTYRGNGFVLCHASYAYREDYESGHIPGAIHLDTIALESPKTWDRRSPDELKQSLQDLGISRDTTVVLYGRFSHPNNEDEYPGKDAGHLAAIRCAQLMLYAGVEDIRILNGGLASWLSAGYELTTEEGRVRPVREFGATIPQRPELIVDTPMAKTMLASDEAELVSVRSWEEFVGHVSGYNYIDKVGRIPGAVFGDCGSDAYHMENYRHIDHTLREYHEIEAIWAASGIVPQKHIAFYCGTGWRASEAFLHAYLMAWPRISVYDSGWLGWSSDPTNPIETGVPA